MTKSYSVTGAGLGLRRSLLEVLSDVDASVDFMEVAPENWINVGGRFGRQLREYSERFPLLCHGLSLSIAGPAKLDWELLKNIKKFIGEHKVRCYSEHLSYCGDDGHLYDLLPIPFTEESVKYVANRIRQVQDFLEQPLAIENISYYAAPQQELSEIDFICAVLEEADCELLLDVNNIYVNSVNHAYDAEGFLAALPGDRIAYGHIAGHFVEAEDLLVDTHGADIIDPVWRLLDSAYQHFGVFPTLLERDFNLPPLNELLAEVTMIKTRQNAAINAAYKAPESQQFELQA
ncbi:MAG: DUF692 domain-containing protein [Porticoccaceae bacterium]|nr:DUF692 domain-containing protein [Porticoccaceae bacterium]